MNAELVTYIAGGVAALATAYAVEQVLRSIVARSAKAHAPSVVIEVAKPGGQTVRVQLQPKDEQSIRSFLRVSEETRTGHANPLAG